MKAGRNDPCPCGSGKKYKKCCWALNQGILPNPARIAASLQSTVIDTTLGSTSPAPAKSVRPPEPRSTADPNIP